MVKVSEQSEEKMSMWVTSMEEFVRRKNIIAKKHPDYPTQWYDADARNSCTVDAIGTGELY